MLIQFLKFEFIFRLTETRRKKLSIFVQDPHPLSLISTYTRESRETYNSNYIQVLSSWTICIIPTFEWFDAISSQEDSDYNFFFFQVFISSSLPLCLSVSETFPFPFTCLHFILVIASQGCKSNEFLLDPLQSNNMNLKIPQNLSLF